ncbi:MAG: hypothetical protein HQL36_00615, partial [Alphaproteobacteria bacterium]|nr:hypothetical protein [Alphaproteobacteria bacterium]
MLKKLVIAFGVLIVAVVVGVYYLLQNVGGIVETVIEDQGTKATQVPVELAGVDVDLGNFAAGLRGLTVGNPAGFKTERALSLGEISVKIGQDMNPNLIIIDEVMVRAPEVTYEIGSGGSNIDAIQKNVENYVKAMTGPAQGGGSSAPSSGDAAGGGEQGPKVMIRDFYIKDGKVNVSASLFQ